jgi:hypothetical protein
MRYKTRIGFAVGTALDMCRDAWHEKGDLNRAHIFLAPFFLPIGYLEAPHFRHKGRYDTKLPAAKAAGVLG